MPAIEFNDKDLLKMIQNETGLDANEYFIFKKEVTDDVLIVIIKQNRFVEKYKKLNNKALEMGKLKEINTDGGN